MKKMTTKQKLSPSALDARLSVWGPKKEGAPDLEYPQNYLVMPEKTAYTTEEFVPVYAVCESSTAAMLFAAAPDLLAACEEAERKMVATSHPDYDPEECECRNDPWCVDCFGCAIVALRAAIAKARGK